jgi:hypothetical protein
MGDIATAIRSTKPGRAGRRKPLQRWRGRRFVITRPDLDEACRSLGIAAPVEIRLTRYRDGACGRLIGFRDGVWIVGLDTYLSPRVASLTLWHELVHIWQAQRAGGIAAFDEVVLSEALAPRVVGPSVRRFFWTRAYRWMPHEREAERRGKHGHRGRRLAVRRSA